MLTIAKSLSNLRALERKRHCLWIFYDMNTSTKSKTVTVNFLAFALVNFRKIWQIGSEYFPLVGVYKTRFFTDLFRV